MNEEITIVLKLNLRNKEEILFVRIITVAFHYSLPDTIIM